MAGKESTTERKILQAKRACFVAEATFYGKPSRFFLPLFDEEHLKRLNLLLAQGHYVNPDLEQAVAHILDESRELLIEIYWQGERQLFSISPEIVSQPQPERGKHPNRKGPPALTVIK